tara:strand:+ start:27280 stop:29124 length:1845 start_codon:yes stop_codon:yes gene_type:complete
MKQQRGALMFTAPLLMLLIIMFGSLALDGARLYSLRQEMQSVANVAATAAADGTRSCGGEASSLSLMTDRAQAAAEAQGVDAERFIIKVTPGVITSASNSVSSFRPVTNVDEIDESNGVVVEVRPRKPEAISSLLPESIFGKIMFSATAAAKKETFATFYTDGYTASVNTDNSVLLSQIFGTVLGGQINLDLVSLQSLANTIGDLGDILNSIAEDVGVPVAELIDSEVPAKTIVQALTQVKGLSGDAVASLDQIIASAGVQTNIKLNDVIDVVGTTQVPEGASVPLMAVLNSLILNLAQMPPLNGEVELDLNPLLDSLGLGTLASIDLSLQIDQAPKVVVAPARKGETKSGYGWLGQADGADITLRLDTSVQVGGAAFSALTLRVPLELSTGMTHTDLVAATCARGTNNSVGYTFDVQRSLLALSTDVSLMVLGAEEPKPVCFPGVLRTLCPVPPADNFTRKYSGLFGEDYGDCCYPPPKCSGLIDVELSSTPVKHDGVPSSPLPFSDLPLQGYVPTSKTLGSGDVLSDSVGDLLDGISVTKADVACLPLGGLLNLTLDLVRPAVKGVLDPVTSNLLKPILDSLGVSLGKATVHVIATKQPPVQLLTYCGPEGC